MMLNTVQALWVLALAVVSSVSAVDTPSVDSSASSFSLTGGVATPVDHSAISMSLSMAAPHAVFTYTSLTGNTASAPYTYTYSGTNVVAGLTGSVATGTDSVKYTAPSTLSCSICSPVVTGATGYSLSTHPILTAGANSNTVSAVAHARVDSDIVCTSGVARTLASPATIDTLAMQPGKILKFTVAAGSGSTTPVTTATIAFSTAHNIFSKMYLVGGGVCPVPAASLTAAGTDPSGTFRAQWDLSANGSTLTGSYQLSNLTSGDYWIYLAPTAAVQGSGAGPVAAGLNTMAASDTITVTWTASATSTCVADANGFCTKIIGPNPTFTDSLTVNSGTTTAQEIKTIGVLQTAPHSVYEVASFTGKTAANSYSYSLTADWLTAATTVVDTVNATVAQRLISNVTCSLCSSVPSTTAEYDLTFTRAINYISSAQTVESTLAAYTDTNVVLTNASFLSLGTADATNYQHGKLFWFTIPSNTSATSGNSTTANLTLLALSNPFNSITVIGAGKCPINSSSNVINTWNASLASNTSLGATYALGNVTTGTYAVYLEPSAAVVAQTASNSLGAGDVITVTWAAFNGTSCTANSTTGFCSSTSGAFTLKAAFGVAAAAVMSAAFMLF